MRQSGDTYGIPGNTQIIRISSEQMETLNRMATFSQDIWILLFLCIQWIDLCQSFNYGELWNSWKLKRSFYRNFQKISAQLPIDLVFLQMLHWQKQLMLLWKGCGASTCISDWLCQVWATFITDTFFFQNANVTRVLFINEKLFGRLYASQNVTKIKRTIFPLLGAVSQCAILYPGLRPSAWIDPRLEP